MVALQRPEPSRCQACIDARTPKDITLGEAMALYSKHHRSSAFALVRTRARSIAASLGMKSCENCGYSKHVEIAHIKPVSSFPLSARISEANSRENIKALCPNCHWEFDHPA